MNQAMPMPCFSEACNLSIQKEPKATAKNGKEFNAWLKEHNKRYEANAL